jgi:hypothetical protein
MDGLSDYGGHGLHPSCLVGPDPHCPGIILTFVPDISVSTPAQRNASRSDWSRSPFVVIQPVLAGKPCRDFCNDSSHAFFFLVLRFITGCRRPYFRGWLIAEGGIAGQIVASLAVSPRSDIRVGGFCVAAVSNDLLGRGTNRKLCKILREQLSRQQLSCSSSF